MSDIKQIARNIDDSVTMKWDEIVEMCTDAIEENCETSQERDKFIEEFMKQNVGGLTTDAMQTAYERLDDEPMDL